jgi:hypothetical protein
MKRAKDSDGEVGRRSVAEAHGGPAVNDVDRAESCSVIERKSGPTTSDVGGIDTSTALARSPGPAYVDASTEVLHTLADQYSALLRVRIAQQNRGLDAKLVKGLESIESSIGAKLTKLLRAHAIWPWLAQYPGLGGVHVAAFIGRMRDPRRFKGPRSLWHYAGLHVVNGKLPKQQRGQRGDWNPSMRAAVLQPGGIAEQIVRLRVPTYRAKYDAAKERIARERGVIEDQAVVGDVLGHAKLRTRAAGTINAIEARDGGPLRPIQIEKRARIIAAKAFVADLWRAWCEVLPSAAELGSTGDVAAAARVEVGVAVDDLCGRSMENGAADESGASGVDRGGATKRRRVGKGVVEQLVRGSVRGPLPARRRVLIPA